MSWKSSGCLTTTVWFWCGDGVVNKLGSEETCLGGFLQFD